MTTFRVALIAALAVADASGVVPSAPLPTGVTQGKTRFTITDASGATVQTQDVDGLEADFTGVPDGTFNASAQFLDSTGALLGSAVTASFVDAVQVPPASTFTPLASLSATVTQE
jgi:hypothetical protein